MVGKNIKLGTARGVVDAKGVVVAVGQNILQLRSQAGRCAEGYKSVAERTISFGNKSTMHKDLADKVVDKWGVHPVSTEVADARELVTDKGQTVESALEISATMLHSTTSLADPPSGQ